MVSGTPPPTDAGSLNGGGDTGGGRGSVKLNISAKLQASAVDEFDETMTSNNESAYDPEVLEKSVLRGLSTILGLFIPSEWNMTVDELFTKLCDEEELSSPTSAQISRGFTKEGLSDQVATMLRCVYQSTSAVVSMAQADHVKQLKHEVYKGRSKILQLQQELSDLKSEHLFNMKEEVRSVVREEVKAVSEEVKAVVSLANTDQAIEKSNSYIEALRKSVGNPGVKASIPQAGSPPTALQTRRDTKDYSSSRYYYGHLRTLSVLR